MGPRSLPVHIPNLLGSGAHISTVFVGLAACSNLRVYPKYHQKIGAQNPPIKPSLPPQQQARQATSLVAVQLLGNVRTIHRRDLGNRKSVAYHQSAVRGEAAGFDIKTIAIVSN